MDNLTWQEKSEKLFGKFWQARLTDFAQVSRRTITRWNSGESRPNPKVMEKLDQTYRIWRE